MDTQVMTSGGSDHKDCNVGALMEAHGYGIPEREDLIKAGLASSHVQRMVSGSQKFEVDRVKITEAGRAILASPAKAKVIRRYQEGVGTGEHMCPTK